MERISARSAMKGGTTEAFYALQEVDLNDHDGDKLIFFDYGSLYPSLAMSRPIFTGDYKILQHHEVITQCLKPCFESGQYLLIDPDGINPPTPVIGIFKVKVVMPRENDHLLSGYPFLPLKVNGTTIRGTCKVCMDTLNKKPCDHTNEQRAFVDTFFGITLVHALSLGYQVVTYFEALFYPKQGDFLVSFFKLSF